MRVGIVAQRGNARAAYLAADIRELLLDRDATVLVDRVTADVLDVDGVDVGEMAAADLVVSIGGDGTFLYAARGAGSTPVLGVNLGEVGFLNAVPPDEALETVAAEVERYRETGAIQHRTVPRVTATGEGDWTMTPAMNEIAVQGHQRGHVDGISLEIRVDGSLYSSARADGVLVATPTGSTAYNLSEGGPLMHPSIGGFAITDMCGAGAMPPVVVPLESTITIRVEDAPTAVVTSDGSSHRQVEPPTELTVEAAAEPARVAGPVSDFFQALNKLE
ncbi:MAG: NAD(+)/NADH kinase [Halodesulfurarchaeum sp.]